MSMQIKSNNIAFKAAATTAPAPAVAPAKTLVVQKNEGDTITIGGKKINKKNAIISALGAAVLVGVAVWQRKNIAGMFKKVPEGAENLENAAKNVVESGKDAIQKTAENVVTTVKKATESAKDAVQNTVENAGKTAKKVAKKFSARKAESKLAEEAINSFGQEPVKKFSARKAESKLAEEAINSFFQESTKKIGVKKFSARNAESKLAEEAINSLM